MATVLTAETIQEELAELPGWQLVGDGIEKKYSFSTFKDAFRFMTTMADYSEEVNHHPDWSNSFKSVSISLSSHDAGGITERDIRWANKADQVFGQI